MLNYGLPPAPEGHRWYIRASEFDKAKRYLHLERSKKTFFGKVRWVSVRKEYMVGVDIGTMSMADSARSEACQILRDINVNFHLPTGEVV